MNKSLISLIMSLALIAVANAQTAYSLDQILDLARRNNIAMRNADRDTQAAIEQRKEAFTRYFPTISATAAGFNADKGTAGMEISIGENLPPELAASIAQVLPAEALAALAQPLNISLMKNGVIAGVTAVQPVFAGGQIVNGNRLARVGEDVSRLQHQLTQNEVERIAEQYYWQLISLQEKVKTLDAIDTLLNSLHHDVSVALSAGVILRNDLLQVELRQNEVASQRLKLENGIALMRMLLAQHCAITDTNFTLVEDTGMVAPTAVRQDHAQALHATPEYQLLGKQVEASQLQHKMEKGKYLPTVAVGAGLNYHNLMEKGRSFGMVFATVSVPISDWWGGTHAIKRKEIALRQAVDEQQDKAELLTIAMQNAWNNVEETYRQIGIARSSVEQAGENLRLNRNFYRAGTTKMSDLLEAQLLHQQALNSLTDAKAAYHNALLAYRHATAQ